MKHQVTDDECFVPEEDCPGVNGDARGCFECGHALQAEKRPSPVWAWLIDFFGFLVLAIVFLLAWLVF